MTQLSREVEKALLVLRDRHEHLFYVAFEMARTRYEVVYRPLTLRETSALSTTGQAIPPYDLNDWIAEKCILLVVSPKGVQSDDYIQTVGPAAMSDVMADFVLGVSGFEDPKNYLALLNQARGEMQTLQASLENFICAAFPGTKPGDVQCMTIYEQMNMLARAEILLGRQLDLEPADAPKKRGARLSPETAAILAQGAADVPNPEADNQIMDPFLTGPERMNSLDPMKEIKERMRPAISGRQQ